MRILNQAYALKIRILSSSVMEYDRVSACKFVKSVSELFQAFVKFAGNRFFVEMLSDEHDFLHPVSVLGVPVVH